MPSLAIFDVQDHERYAPSSSSIWKYCPGSVKTDWPDESGPEAELGTLAHAYAASILSGKPLSPEDEKKIDALPDETYREMVLNVQVYIDFVNRLPGVLRVETKIKHPTIADFGGTVDAIRVTEDTLHIVDLKYGLMFVPSWHNDQLLCYLVLARKLYPNVKKFFYTIVQPRVQDGRISTEEATSEEIDAQELAVIEAVMDDAIIAGGHCRWCPLLNTCEVARAHGLELAATDFDNEPSIKRCEEILQFENVFKELVSQAKSKLMVLAHAGERLLNFKAAQSYGHRQWKNPDNVAAMLELQDIDPEILYDRKLKSPAQLEKEVPKDWLKEQTYKPFRGITIVKRSSRLNEADLSDFDKVTEQFTDTTVPDGAEDLF